MAHSLGLDVTRPVRAAIPLCQARCVSQGPTRRQTHALKGPRAPRARVGRWGGAVSRPLTGRLGHLVPGDATLYLIPVNLPVLCLAIPALLCGLHVSEAPGEPPGETQQTDCWDPCKSRCLIAERLNRSVDSSCRVWWVDVVFVDSVFSRANASSQRTRKRTRKLFSLRTRDSRRDQQPRVLGSWSRLSYCLALAWMAA